MFWKHHCNKCEYITSIQLDHRYGNQWDIYLHRHSENLIEFVARHGDNPEDYIADDNIANYDQNHPLGYYHNSINFSDFTASIRLLSTEEGGRKSPVASGYRPSIRFQFDDYLTTGYHTFTETLEPGKSSIADIKIISRDYFLGKLKEGMLFDIFEGNRKVGNGIITIIINNNLRFI